MSAISLEQDLEKVSLKTVEIDSEVFFKITNSNAIRPFFMSVVSDSNHWMFISSNGGLSAGRKDADNAIFPYYTDDKITESTEITGSKTIFRINRNGSEHLWEPFTNRNEGRFKYTRNLYKSLYGNKILFEEINHDLDITFRYKWSSSNEYGFIRDCHLSNNSDEEIQIHLLDGIQNILPSGVNSDLQTNRSNLADAYKRSEIDEKSGLGIFALSAIIVDRAEPSEALKANVAWCKGLNSPTYLLSSLQLDKFRNNQKIDQETDVKAEKGAYLVSDFNNLKPGEEDRWMMVVNVNQDASQIESLSDRILNDSMLLSSVVKDIEIGTDRLLKRVAASDGFQLTADPKRNARHYSNTLFNIMRGGIFDENYQIEKWDFTNHLNRASNELAAEQKDNLDKVPEVFTYQELQHLARETKNNDFIRLALEYLPLRFSRRHGDPSRPWNKFSINTRSEVDGSKILDYEGNWRDIFQNWEALALSYPEFIDGMIFRFLNASTFDGYNPYRVTKDGFDWETIEPDDPWSYIGYWGDHQIIYLLKFLEIIENHYPSRLNKYFKENLFVYANVPYQIKGYEEILEDPKDTILFNEKLDNTLRRQRDHDGADGALLKDRSGNIHRVNFIEKLLATALAKLSNFIPEGGIWLNTQRPEWNDANNALVGNGVSMVTLYYLRRFFEFLSKQLSGNSTTSIVLSEELYQLFVDINRVFDTNKNILSGLITDYKRKEILDGLGMAGSRFRTNIYEQSFSGSKQTLSISELQSFVELVLSFLDHSIDANKRTDGMYHAYNLMTIQDDDQVSLNRLSEMLEGQVAVLSSGYLSAEGSLEVLDAMKSSKLFREDQYSYLLYPNSELPKFLEKNIIPEKSITSSPLLTKLVQGNNSSIVLKDLKGKYHFSGNFRNAEDLKEALDNLSDTPFAELASKDRHKVLQVFEEVFNHKAFTGRSGTFFGYEGLGSIYWHMVSKLLLAVEECAIEAIEGKESPQTIGKLLEHFYEINEGIGVHKSPKLYGAFPIDPYSHTPIGKGTQQPGMTGQVKEDILSRIGELGVFVKNGCIQFNPHLLRAEEFIRDEETFEYIDIDQERGKIPLPENSLAFTYCQIPIVYTISDTDELQVVNQDGTTLSSEVLRLDVATSSKVFRRSGEVKHIHVKLKNDHLK